MAISQAKRTELHQELRDKLTMETADTLMDHLPPDGWSDVAMKSDLHTLEVVMKSEISRLRAETKTEFAEVRLEIAELRAEIKVLVAGFNETLATAIAKQNKWMTGVLASLVAAMIVALLR